MSLALQDAPARPAIVHYSHLDLAALPIGTVVSTSGFSMRIVEVGGRRTPDKMFRGLELIETKHPGMRLGRTFGFRHISEQQLYFIDCTMVAVTGLGLIKQ